MRIEHQVIAAVGLDLLLGDPRWFPHPVRLMGKLAMATERTLRTRISNERTAGIVTAIVVVGVTIIAAFLFIHGAGTIHPLAGDLASIAVLYTCLAARDLAGHSEQVLKALMAGDLPEARRRVAMIVGRDTMDMDETEICRATVESLAENLVDGVTAPLFYGIIGGPLAAIAYKAVNTLDSTFGYKNEKYLNFGWASARIDDLVNYLPARITAPLIVLSALVLGFRPGKSWAILLRDGHKHASPNAGLAEAAVAGALGIELGGLNSYFGHTVLKPKLGDQTTPLSRHHISQARAIMWTTSLLALLILLTFRFLAL